MNHSAITALSPLDGRYANKLTALRALMSEQGYMHRRVQVEVAWLVALSEAGWAEFPALSTAARAHLRALVANFGTADASAIAVNAVFFNKMVLLVLGLLNAWLFRRLWWRELPQWDIRPPLIGRLQALASIAIWLLLATAGRLIAYF